MFISHSICGTLSQQPKQTKITVAVAFADGNHGQEKPKKHEGWGISGALGALWYLRRAVTLSSGPTGPPPPTYSSNKTSVNSTSVWGAEQSNRERGVLPTGPICSPPTPILLPLSSHLPTHFTLDPSKCCGQLRFPEPLHTLPTSVHHLRLSYLLFHEALQASPFPRVSWLSLCPAYILTVPCDTRIVNLWST